MKSFWNARRRYLLLLAFRRARQCSELASFGQKAGETFGLFASHKRRPCLAARGAPVVRSPRGRGIPAWMGVMQERSRPLLAGASGGTEPRVNLLRTHSLGPCGRFLLVDDEFVADEHGSRLLPALAPRAFKSAPADQCGELVQEEAANGFRRPAFRDRSALAMRIVNAGWQVVDVQLRHVDILRLASTSRAAARASGHPVQDY